MPDTNLKVTKISASFGGKVNTGNYSNVDVLVTVEAEIVEGDDVHLAIDEAQHIAKTAVLAEVEALNSPQKLNWLEAVGRADKDDLPY